MGLERILGSGWWWWLLLLLLLLLFSRRKTTNLLTINHLPSWDEDPVSKVGGL